ncbi:MAG: 6-phosphogluconolactonase [Rhizobiaceae bacterium]
MAIERHTFSSVQALADALADCVAANLLSGINERGAAVLAVSGGSTPKLFFKALALRPIDWSKVSVTLVDERWVGPDSDRSNARLVNENLLTGAAASARFVPLWSGGDEPDEAALARTNGHLSDLASPFDAVILGMGNDGHTASFFPGGNTLHEALTSNGPALPLAAPGAGETRITLTLPVLLNTKALYLHIEGPDKAASLEKALGEGTVEDMPVRAVLRQARTPVDIYHA